MSGIDKRFLYGSLIIKLCASNLFDVKALNINSSVNTKCIYNTTCIYNTRFINNPASARTRGESTRAPASGDWGRSELLSPGH